MISIVTVTLLLISDPEDFGDFNLDFKHGECTRQENTNKCNSTVEDDQVTLSQAEFRAVVQRMKDSESRASQLHEQLQLAIDDLNKMK